MGNLLKKTWFRILLSTPILGGLGYYLDYYGFKESYYTDVYYELIEYKMVNPENLLVKATFDGESTDLFDHKLYVKLNGERLQVVGKPIAGQWTFDLTEDPKFYDLKSNSKNFLQFAFKRPDKYFGEQLSVTFQNKVNKKAMAVKKVDEAGVTETENAAVLEGNIASNAIVKIYMDGQIINILKGTEFKTQYQLNEFKVIHSKSANGRIVELTVEEK